MNQRIFYTLLGTALIDQITKLLVLNYKALLPIKVFSFFNIVLAWNRGISFGMFNNHNSIVFWILTLLAVGIVFFLFLYMRSQTRQGKRLFIALVIGGAIGNIIDRIWHGAVVDFLDFHLYNYHWPAFNVADSAIVVGVLLLMIDMYRYDKKSS